MQASGACREEGAQRRRKRIKEKKSRERKRERRGKKEKKGEVEGLIREKEKRGEGGCKRQGVGKQNSQGISRVWRLGGLGPVWATLSQTQKLLFCKI